MKLTDLVCGVCEHSDFTLQATEDGAIATCIWCGSKFQIRPTPTEINLEWKVIYRSDTRKGQK